MPSSLIIVNGLAATGKTTIAKDLAKRLNYVFLSKDGIKESLFDDLGIKDRSWSKDLGKASFSLLYQYLEELVAKGVSVVVETNFVSEYDSKKFFKLKNKYSPDIIQILCYADGKVLYERFVKRSQSSERHKGHLDFSSKEEHQELLLTGKAELLEIDSPVVEVDTTDWSAVSMEMIYLEVLKREE